MATLRGRDFRGVCQISVSPIKPADARDATEYQLFWSPGGRQKELESKYSVKGWQEAHDPIWLIGRAFAESSRLRAVSSGIDIWRSGREDTMALYVNAHFLRVVLKAAPKQGSLAVQCYIQTTDQPDCYRSLAFVCTEIE